jgi:FkbM family methyltransferase
LWYEHTIINLEHLSNVKVHPLGLGEEEKTEKIWIAEHNIGGSSMVPHEKRMNKWMRNANFKEVKVVTLDSFNLTNVDFIKIDVESYEYEVLKGEKNTIETNKPIIGIELLQSYQPNYKEIVKYIESLGYRAIEKMSNDVIFKPIK